MNTVVQACIGQTTKDEATVNLDTFGLTVFDIFRLMMRRIVAEKRLPFDPIVPNATTLAAIDDANRGGLDSIEKLFANLRDGRDDCWNDPAAPLVQLRLPPRRHRTAQDGTTILSTPPSIGVHLAGDGRVAPGIGSYEETRKYFTFGIYCA